jgi:hypothetical protein
VEEPPPVAVDAPSVSDLPQVETGQQLDATAITAG